LAVFVCGTVMAQTQAKEPLRVPHPGGKTIAEVLRLHPLKPIVLERSYRPLMVEPLPGTSAIEWHVYLADVVAVIEIVDSRSRMTGNESWIVTDIAAIPIEIMKLSNHQPPEEIRFTLQGGSLELKGRKVVAEVTWARTCAVGSRYLMMASVAKDGRYIVNIESLWELAKDRLVAMDKKERKNEFTASALNEALAEVRVSARRRGAGTRRVPLRDVEKPSRLYRHDACGKDPA
ncbi:MAG: hypothetical protein V3T83_12670, partial [Acidobacteriota bacterium]